MRKVVKLVGMPALIAIASMGASAQAAGPKPEMQYNSALQVTQFHGALDPLRVQAPNNPALYAAMSRDCGVPTERVQSITGLAIFGGIVVDWLSGLAMKYISERAAANIKAHTASYSNTLEYGDMFDGTKWSKEAQSCVVAQRWYCTQDTALTDCPNESRKLASTMVFVLRRDGGALKALPLGYEVARFVPRHSKGKVAFSAGLSVNAIGTQDGGSQWWTSKRDGKEALLLDESCDADKASNAKDCTDVSKLDWSKAAVLPMPPALPAGSNTSLAALEVTVGEAGRPSRLSKAWASFTAASEDSLSEAMSTALKKQWKLSEDE